jgi:hypothetical protein
MEINRPVRANAILTLTVRCRRGHACSQVQSSACRRDARDYAGDHGLRHDLDAVSGDLPPGYQERPPRSVATGRLLGRRLALWLRLANECTRRNSQAFKIWPEATSFKVAALCFVRQFDGRKKASHEKNLFAPDRCRNQHCNGRLRRDPANENCAGTRGAQERAAGHRRKNGYHSDFATGFVRS